MRRVKREFIPDCKDCRREYAVKREKFVTTVANILEEHFATLSPAKRRAARRKLHSLAERVAKRGR